MCVRDRKREIKENTKGEKKTSIRFAKTNNITQ